MITNTSIPTKAGEIRVKETPRGIEFHAWNHERNKSLHIGTIKGQTYEADKAILRLPWPPGFALTADEYAQAVRHGAVYLRFIPKTGEGTFSISLSDFDRYAIDYYHPAYGKQLKCPLDRFSQTNKKAQRNPILDSPKQGPGPEFVRPQPEQLPLFVARPHFD